jgi:hypothetical protein
VAKANKGKDFGGKKSRSNCRAARGCNVSDTTNSVEFANEPFAEQRQNKCAEKKQDNNNLCR